MQNNIPEVFLTKKAKKKKKKNLCSIPNEI